MMACSSAIPDSPLSPQLSTMMEVPDSPLSPQLSTMMEACNSNSSSLPSTSGLEFIEQRPSPYVIMQDLKEVAMNVSEKSLSIVVFELTNYVKYFDEGSKYHMPVLCEHLPLLMFADLLQVLLLTIREAARNATGELVKYSKMNNRDSLNAIHINLLYINYTMEDLYKHVTRESEVKKRSSKQSESENEVLIVENIFFSFQLTIEHLTKLVKNKMKIPLF